LHHCVPSSTSSSSWSSPRKHVVVCSNHHGAAGIAHDRIQVHIPVVYSKFFDWKGTKRSSEEKIAKSVESLQSQLNTLRTSGANPNILDRIIVDCFDSTSPLNQVARVSAAGSQLLLVEPFDKALIKEIEKAIMCSNLNLNPNSDGDVIRINLPPLTEDRRKDMVKQAGTVCESSKVAIRNIRRDCVDKIKQAEKVKDIGKDESKGYQVLTF